eukprot:scaffold2286_cov32-Attheya_sp.AAC.1
MAVFIKLHYKLNVLGREDDRLAMNNSAMMCCVPSSFEGLKSPKKVSPGAGTQMLYNVQNLKLTEQK